MRLALILALMAALAGCDDTLFGKPIGEGEGEGSSEGEGEGEGDSGDTAGSGDDWCSVKAIFAAACVSCHSAGGGSGGLDLVTDPYATIVGQPSIEYSGTTLVVAGDAPGSLLYRKVSGTQSSSEGSVMPLGSGLDAARVAVIEAWITAGATDTCGDTAGDTDTAIIPERHHPDGYNDPELHGPDAKLQTETCTTCHGADLSGGDVGVSCDSCHDDGWRTNCTFCHGGTDNSTGAPPRDILGETDESLLSFAAHTAHVTTDDIKDAFDCEMCHDKPTDVLSTGHIFVGDSTSGVAEMDFTGGLSTAGVWNSTAQTCTNLYCHGNGQGDNGDATVGEDFSDCASCHPWQYSGSTGWRTMSGQHDRHLSMGTGFECGDCHKDVVDYWEPILDTSLHVNGEVNVRTVGSILWDPATKTCTGECHTEIHDANEWIDTFIVSPTAAP